MKRRYSIDDCDFDAYKANGGELSRAEYFNALLGPRPKVQLQYADRKPVTRLDSRIRDNLKEQ